jgi:predicted acetyltransferase
MENLKLVFPAQIHEKQAWEFLQEFRENNSEINGVSSLDKYVDFSAWLEEIQKRLSFLNEVPSAIFFLIRERDEKLVGSISIRYRLNDRCKKLFGNIGYSIRPTERLKGYATRLLSMGLKKCEEVGLKEVLVTCLKDNIGSAKTIKNNNGVLVGESVDENGNIYQKYVIKI